MKLVELHREFIDRSVRPMISQDLPIKVSNQDKPIIAIEKWKVVSGSLNKKFMFENYGDRNRFLHSMLEYETQAGHHASYDISELEVTINLITKDVNKVTELDKEFARYADKVRKDLIYRPDNARF